ncbi:MAG: alpha-hydroxy-acid oxidizing protein [Gemmiger sp.]|nr:alpha-hydroxy-acid oxidizing protein [Gemmiger sp.]
MTYRELLQAAQGKMGPCHACPVCNGRACGNTIPGPGAKGSGDVAIRNYDAWQRVRLHMDTLHENVPVATSCTLFGKTFRYPIFAGPVGATALHYGPLYDDMAYNNILVPACAAAGIAAFTGDGTNPQVMVAATAAVQAAGGMGVPTVKPWDPATLAQKMALVAQSGCFALAMDIDAAGLPFLQNLTPPAGSKTVAELREIVAASPVPFVVKGIMTPAAALKAEQAGAAAIVVSNHGGRVLDGCPATAEVLPAIVQAVGGRMKVLVDGGIRTGTDVFRALALGADAVLVARPYVTAVYGGGAEGVALYTHKLGAELADAMAMCGAATLADITPAMVGVY